MTQSQHKYELLNTIDSPADLKKLAVEQLPQLCQEIREFLIENLSQNPGHFASSMGAVELTVALHYVYDTPRDLLVWDVGHQAYPHKILTGRRDQFTTIRKKDGLSGFPSPAESEYDTFAAGHASNSISAALGMAVATELNNDEPRRHVAAIIGDASISGGLAFEGLNNAANTRSNMLIVLNDNNMSIDHNVGSLHRYLGHLNTSKSYNNMRYRLFNFLKKCHLVTDRQRGPIMRFNNSLKALIFHEHNLFEGLNIRYLGPIDGHDVIRLVRVLSDIKDMKGPRLLHLRTVKGRGYEPAEKNPSKWHAPGKFDPETGETVKGGNAEETKRIKWQDVFGRALLELAREDNRVVGITAAMSSGTSVNILQGAMPDRVFDVGISEGHAVTFAGGLASQGLRPFVAIYSSFLQRAYDNIINDNALYSLPVTYCIDRAGLVGADGATHNGALDLAYLNPVPGLTVTAPADAATLRNLMYTSLKTEHGPWAIRYPRGTVSTQGLESSFEILETGKARCVREGSDVAILSLGATLEDALAAADRLASDGVKVAVYDMIFLKPIDVQLLEKLRNAGTPILTIEDGTVKGGLATTVAQWMKERDAQNRVASLGLPDRFIKHATVDEQHLECRIDTQSIVSTVKKMLS